MNRKSYNVGIVSGKNRHRPHCPQPLLPVHCHLCFKFSRDYLVHLPNHFPQSLQLSSGSGETRQLPLLPSLLPTGKILFPSAPACSHPPPRQMPPGSPPLRSFFFFP